MRKIVVPYSKIMNDKCLEELYRPKMEKGTSIRIYKISNYLLAPEWNDRYPLNWTA